MKCRYVGEPRRLYLGRYKIWGSECQGKVKVIMEISGNSLALLWFALQYVCKYEKGNSLLDGFEGVIRFAVCYHSILNTQEI